jgi:hypothetical protein
MGNPVTPTKEKAFLRKQKGFIFLSTIYYPLIAHCLVSAGSLIFLFIKTPAIK